MTEYDPLSNESYRLTTNKHFFLDDLMEDGTKLSSMRNYNNYTDKKQSHSQYKHLEKSQHSVNQNSKYSEESDAQIMIELRDKLKQRETSNKQLEKPNEKIKSETCIVSEFEHGDHTDVNNRQSTLNEQMSINSYITKVAKSQEQCVSVNSTHINSDKAQAQTNTNDTSNLKNNINHASSPDSKLSIKQPFSYNKIEKSKKKENCEGEIQQDQKDSHNYRNNMSPISYNSDDPKYIQENDKLYSQSSRKFNSHDRTKNQQITRFRESDKSLLEEMTHTSKDGYVERLQSIHENLVNKIVSTLYTELKESINQSLTLQHPCTLVFQGKMEILLENNDPILTSLLENYKEYSALFRSRDYRKIEKEIELQLNYDLEFIEGERKESHRSIILIKNEMLYNATSAMFDNTDYTLINLFRYLGLKHRSKHLFRGAGYILDVEMEKILGLAICENLLKYFKI